MGNETQFEKLLIPQFTVKLTSVEDCIFECRDIPGVTAEFIIESVVRATQASYEEEKAKILASLEELNATGGISSDADMRNMLDTVLPVLVRLLSTSSELLSRTLKDVVIGIADDDVKLLSMADTTLILATAVERIDTDLMARTLRPFFQWIMTTFMKAKPETKELETEQKNQEASENSSASTESEQQAE